MTKICVFSTASQNGFNKFAKNFIEQFYNYMPQEVELHFFVDGYTHDYQHDGLFYHDINEVKGLREFQEKHKDDASKCGIVEQKGQPTKYYRIDAITYASVVYPLRELINDDVDWLIRLDPDQIFKRKLPYEILKRKLDDQYTAIYLGRKDWPHSETGFVAYNLKNHGNEMIHAMVEAYDTGHIFNLPGYTDCDVFDYIRKEYEQQFGYKFQNISEGVEGMHVWPKTWLGEYTEHLKGPAAKEGVEGLNELPTTMMGQALHTVAQFKPRTIMDIGVLDGNRAIQFAKASLWSQSRKNADNDQPVVHLWAVDSFGDKEEEIVEKLSKFSEEDKRFSFSYFNLKKSPENWNPELQVVHERLGRIELGKADFAYVDGEHTVEALRRDLLKMCPYVKMVMSPTYFLKDDKGKGADTSYFGCNEIMDKMPHKILPAAQECDDGGIVRAVVFGPAITPGHGKVQTRNAVADEQIHKNIAYSIKHDPLYIEKEIQEHRSNLKEIMNRRKVPFLRQCDIHGLTALVIGGGPSVSNKKHPDFKKNWDKIQEYMKRDDVRTFTCKTTHDVMIYDLGILPNACVLLDPRGHVKDFVSEPHPDVTYFVCSMCDPSTWNLMLEKAKKIIGYNAAVKAGEIDFVFKELKHKKAQFFGGGSASPTRALGLCHGLGFRRFILAGFDQQYYPEIEEINLDAKDDQGRPKFIKTKIDDVEYITAPILIAACQDVESSLHEHPDLFMSAITEGMVAHVLRKIKHKKHDFFTDYDI